MPTWDVTLGYIKACGVTGDKQIEQWKNDWQIAEANSKIIPGNRRLTFEEMPDPRWVGTYDDLLDQLSKLKIAAGNLPYRSFYFGTRPAATGKPAVLPTSTVSDLFTGRHVSRFDLFAQVVQGLVNQVVGLYGSPGPDAGMSWHNPVAWHAAWHKALAARNLPSTKANRAQEDLAETISWIAAEDPDYAAVLLARLKPHRRAQVLQDLPLDVATRIRQAGSTAARPSPVSPAA
nr:hypothetical protein [Actinoplanes sp. N902-109]